MASGHHHHLFLPLLLLLSTISTTLSSQSLIKMLPEYSISDDLNIRSDIDEDLYCDSWRFAVETNDAGFWERVPERCVAFVEAYMTGERYRSDSEVVAAVGSEFAKTVKVAGDGRDAWVFDVDETLLSNVPYYEAHGFGSEAFDERSFDDWVDLAEAPALLPSLRLYKELKALGFKIFLLTGRSEPQRNATEKNLLFAGYTDWQKLILRGVSDSGKPATVYKSEKRMGLESEGYRIHGSSGDQWSDLSGSAVARRSFKLPNPMYYIA